MFTESSATSLYSKPGHQEAYMDSANHFVAGDELAQTIGTYDDAICRYLGNLRRHIEQDPEPKEGDCAEVLHLKELLRSIYRMRTQRSTARATLISRR
jgi:hypothetical protein